MKKLLFTIIFGIFTFTGFSFALLDSVVNQDKITKDQRDVVDDSGIEDPLVDGSTNLGTQMKGTINNAVSNSEQAQTQTLAVIKGVLNRALGLLSLIALIYLMYGGFSMVTAAGDDGKYDKGFKAMRNAALALMGIGFSWFITYFIFDVILKIGG